MTTGFGKKFHVLLQAVMAAVEKVFAVEFGENKERGKEKG